MITFRQRGDFSKLTNFLERAKEAVHLGNLDKYGQEGVAALASATPVDTGQTANSWHYKIEQKNGSVSIGFYNTNIQNGVPIAIILQYGHAHTKAAGYREETTSTRYPMPIFDKIADTAWREVTKL